MERFIHLVDYATTMDWDFPPVLYLNTSFMMVGGRASSPYLDRTLYDLAINKFDFLEMDPEKPFAQKFEELNPVWNFERFQFTIYPNIFITMPDGFDLDIDCLLPGLGVKHILMDRTTRTFDWDDEYEIPSRFHGTQKIRLVGTSRSFYIYYITEIKFEIRDTDYVLCTPEGIIVLGQQWDETNILDIKFKCKNKVNPELYADKPVPNPHLGCELEHYRYLYTIRNSTIFNLLKTGRP